MRNFLAVVLGLLIFAGAAGWLYVRQMAPIDDGAPAMATRTAPDAKRADRGIAADRLAERRERRIDRGLAQYKRNDGTWNTVSAVIDVLNVIVGIVGIGLALRGMRGRREA